jgi:heme-degrading monooxygenase HmoA
MALPSTPIARIWRTQIDPGRAEEYESFARQRSLPMFCQHAGLLGVLFGGAGTDRVVITIWQDAAAATALEQSSRYGATVDAIHEAGFLRPPQQVDYLPLHGGWLTGRSLDEICQ